MRAKLVLVASLKGGVGKTTVSVGLARALVRAGRRVGILDTDYRTPNVPVALGATALSLTRASGDVLIPPSVDGIQVMSMAYLWPEEKCVEVSDDDAMSDIVQLLTPGIIGWDPDYIVVDTPPTATGTVRAALEASGVLGAFIVSHPSRVARADCLRTIDLFREHQVPILALISNMGRDNEGRQMYDLSEDDLRTIADAHSLPFTAIPYSRDPRGLDVHFDALAGLILRGQVVLLAREEVSEVVWRRVVEASRRLRRDN